MSIHLEEVCLTYQIDTPFKTEALHNITCTIPEGEITGVIGPTGSGKTTLLQLLNGLLKPTSGQVWVDGVPTSRLKGKELILLRNKVGLVFQSPEEQLFEHTVYDDIAFGLRNRRLPEKEIAASVRWAMELVGLPYDELKHRSPHELSGGQKRRVALAGTLAMRPKYLLLDEPGAGLDPQGRHRLLGVIRYLVRHYNTTVVLVSHHLEDVTATCDRLVILNRGRLFMEGRTREMMARREEILAAGLELPFLNELVWKLKEYRPELDPALITLEEVADEIERVFGAKYFTR